MKLADIARHTGCTLEGDGTVEIERLAGIEDAGPGDLTFLSNPRYGKLLRTTGAAALFLAPGMEGPAGCAILRSPNPYLAFAKAIELFYRPPRRAPGVHVSAVVDEAAHLGKDVAVGPHTVIEAGVTIGDRTEVGANVTIHTGAKIGSDGVIHSNAVVREHVRIGDRVILQNGAVIGADGFGFAPTGDGDYYKMLQSGTVILEDDVEVGANATVDRATVGATIVRRGTKLDNLVQVGHGCTIGEDTVIAAQTGIGGSTRVGSRVMLGGQVGIAGHVTIEDGVIAAARSGVTGSVRSGATISGYPHEPIAVWRRLWGAIHQLPDALKRLRRVERALGLRGDPEKKAPPPTGGAAAGGRARSSRGS